MKDKLKDLPIPVLPIFTTPDKPLVGLSQDNLPIAEILEDMILFKDGGAAVVLESSSLNFGLLSMQEQEAVIAAFASLINSLSFPIQIVVKTQRKDISKYLSYLNERADKIKIPQLRDLFNSYRNFVIETTKRRNVLGKRFFVIISFSPFELGVSSTFKSFTSRAETLPYTKSYVIRKAKVALSPKEDHISRQMARLGLRAKRLTNDQLTALFYEVYNPNKETVQAKKEVSAEEEYAEMESGHMNISEESKEEINKLKEQQDLAPGAGINYEQQEIIQNQAETNQQTP